jgi:hypothetical protein
MITYLIRQDSEVQFTVSKWDMGTAPIQVYRVEMGKNDALKCNCPSGMYNKYCRHADMVRAWIKEGMPVREISA